MNQYKVRKTFIYVDGSLHWRENKSTRIRAGDRAGHINKHGYRRIIVDGKIYLEHRLIFLYHYGFLPEYIDHIDRNRSNNRIGNLREATPSLSSHNRSAYGKSGLKGVSECSNGKYQAAIRKNGKYIYIGRFNTALQASKAYYMTANRLYG